MTTLARYDGIAFGLTGSTVVLSPLASVQVKREDTGALVSLFSDRAGAVGISNPMTADAFGRFGFYCAATTDGLRIQVTEAASPGLQYTLRNQKCGTMGELDFNTLTLALLGATTADSFLQTLISNLTADPNFARGDLLPFGDVSEGKGNVATLANLFSAFGTLLPIELSPTKAADYAVTFDSGSPGELRLTLLQDMPLPKNYLAGGTLSNTTFGSPNDLTNDIDIAAGEARDSTDAQNIKWAALNAKRLDAIFSAGSLGGMLDADPSPPGLTTATYHVFAIRKDSDGSGDVLASLSATAPTMPSGYTFFRRIGSLLREAGSIVQFSQNGDEFLRKQSVLDVSATNPGIAAVTRTLSVPTGIQVWAFTNWFMSQAWAGAQTSLYISSLDANDEASSANGAAPLSQVSDVMSTATGTESCTIGTLRTRTNTSGQVRSRMSASDGNVSIQGATLGWIDRRGRD